MAVIMNGSSAAKKIARFSLTTANAGELSDFYQKAFGCRIVETERVDGADFERSMGVQGGAIRMTLALGEQVVELLQFDKPGSPYPKETSASDLIFQHFAIVVSDMAKAHAHLSAIPHWGPISLGGPQKLPPSSGGVTAFKFRDPEGHPLELLAFPENNVPAGWQKPKDILYRGIDHSAISVSDITASVAFYEELGFAVTSRSINDGPVQQELDDILAVKVEVVALTLGNSAPHLELLCYSANATSAPARLKNNDVAATRTVLAGVAERCLVDPDGHKVAIV